MDRHVFIIVLNDITGPKLPNPYLSSNKTLAKTSFSVADLYYKGIILHMITIQSSYTSIASGTVYYFSKLQLRI